MNLHIGTFTDGFMGGTPGRGIYTVSFDPHLLKFDIIDCYENIISPSYLCRHPIHPIMYAASRKISTDSAEGCIYTFGINKNGTLDLLDRRGSAGINTAHISLSPDGSCLSHVNPGDQSVCYWQVDTQGIPEKLQSKIQHYGKGARPRQDAPWPHSSYFLTDHISLVCDLGLDKIFFYQKNGWIQPSIQSDNYIQLPSGAGCRHLAISTDKNYVYVNNELDSSLAVFQLDKTRLRGILIQYLKTCPERSIAENKPSEIILSKKHQFLYTANRGHNSIACFSIENNGILHFINYRHLQQKEVRHLCLSECENYLFTCFQLSDTVEVYKIQEDGSLSEPLAALSIPSPACLISHFF